MFKQQENRQFYSSQQPSMDPVVHKHHKIKFQHSSTLEKNSAPLLDIEEIEDVCKIYQYKKKVLNIENQKMNKNNWIQEEEKEVKIALSAQQIIQQYNKNRREQQRRNRIEKYKQKDIKPRPRLQATPLKNILKRILDYSATQERSSSYMSQIKQSDKELHFVKCNPTRKRRIMSSNSSQFHRKRILSLKDGLPMQIGKVYPTLQEKIQQMKPPPAPAKLTFDQRFERTMNNFFSHSQYKASGGEQIGYFNNEKIKQQKLMNKAKMNMNRSVDNVEKILTTVGEHYVMKHTHKQDYEQLVSTWRVDRPRTNQLRSKNYNINMIANNKKKNLLDAFRKTSQNIRSNEMQKSRKFYDDLLNFVLSKTKSIDALPLTKIICDQIRQELEINLKLSLRFLTNLILEIEKLKQRDDLADSVIQRTKQYINFSQ